VTSIGYADGSSETFTYNSTNQLISKVERSGARGTRQGGKLALRPASRRRKCGDKRLGFGSFGVGGSGVQAGHGPRSSIASGASQARRNGANRPASQIDSPLRNPCGIGPAAIDDHFTANPHQFTCESDLGFDHR
jgi:hypothetical protein